MFVSCFWFVCCLVLGFVFVVKLAGSGAWVWVLRAGSGGGFGWCEFLCVLGFWLLVTLLLNLVC